MGRGEFCWENGALGNLGCGLRDGYFRFRFEACGTFFFSALAGVIVLG